MAISINEVRQKFPEYSDLSDGELLQGIHSKFYSDIPFEEFSSSIEITTPTVAVTAKRATQEEIDAFEAEQAGIPTTPTNYLQGEEKYMPQYQVGANPFTQEDRQNMVRSTGLVKGMFEDPINSIKQFFSEEDRIAIAKADELYEKKRQEAGLEGFDIPRLVGSIASPATFVGGAGGLKAANALSKFASMFGSKAGKGALASAGAGAFLPVTSENEAIDQFVLDKLGQTGFSLAVGGGISKLASAINPRLKQGARELINKGVEVNPGQAYEGIPGWVFRQIEGIKWGDKLSDSQKLSFSVATGNEVLSSIGQKVNPTLKSGQDVVGAVTKSISNYYDDAFSQIGVVNLDNAYINSIKLALNKAQPDMTATQFKKVKALVEQNLRTKLKAMGTNLEIDGKQLKELDEFFKKRAKDYDKLTDSDGLALKNLFDDLLNANTAFTSRADPTGMVTKANEAWTKLYRFADASTKASKQSGNITPEQLMTASTQQGSTLQAGAGKAPMQKYANEALDILGGDVDPLKATYRSLAIGSKLTAGSALTWASPQIAIPVLVASGISYKAAQQLMKSPSASRIAVEKALQKLAPRTANLVIRKALDKESETTE